ncbi:MAG: FKBP-type peptidyl-prolyl cis-trans isomerase [Bacteroidota bacterium]
MSTPKVISLSYELRSGSPEGEVIEVANKENPAEFLFGTGSLIPEFENQVVELAPGESFEFLIDVDNAYGQTDPNAIVNLPRSVFTIDGKEASDLLYVGNVVPMKSQEGKPLNGKIIEIADETVKMDFNHPLAGHNLHFKGEVLEKRDASSEEIEHGHVHTGKDDH